MSHGSHKHGCDGDTVVVTFSNTTHDATAFSPSDLGAIQGCPTGGNISLINACLLSRGFNIAGISGGDAFTTVIYVRC